MTERAFELGAYFFITFLLGAWCGAAIAMWRVDRTARDKAAGR